MDKNVLLECIQFFNNVTIVEKDVTTDDERNNGQYVVKVTFSFEGKSYTTNKLYYKNINQQHSVKPQEPINDFFEEPVFWLDIDTHDWPTGQGAKLETVVIPSMVSVGNQEFTKFLKDIANDQKDGYEQLLTWEGRSAQYSINLENNNQWHDIIKLIQAIIKSNGREVDKKYFSRLVFEWDNMQRTSLHPHFGSRALIGNLYKNIASIHKELEMENIINLLKYKKQIILQGPPGTGKTFTAKKIADELTKGRKVGSPQQIIDDFFKNFDANSPDTIKHRIELNGLLKEFQDKFPRDTLKDLTLQDYAIGTGENNSFCWWIERGLKPLGYYFPGSARSYLIYWSKEKDKYSSHFKHSSELSKAESLDDAMKLLASMIFNLVINKDYNEVLKVLGNSYILKILHSYYPDEYAPINSAICLKNALKLFRVDYSKMNVIEMNLKLQEIFLEKKNVSKKDITNLDFMRFLFDKFDLKGNIEVEADEVITKGESKLIQFHPAYSYEDFVRGITVEMNVDKQPEYKVVNKIIAEFSEKSLNNPSANFVLIIDEINRANLPSVLGELIYALEYRYDETNEKETTVESMYALKRHKDDEDGDRKLMLPKNLYIIGTMNTADRSVAHIDYAIRRRFAFVDIEPSSDPIDEVIKDPVLNKKAKDLFVKVTTLFYEGKNEADQTKVYLQSDFKKKDVQLGHSYFLVSENDKTKLEISGEEILNLKLEYEIKPLLYEYVKDGILSEEARSIIKTL